MSQYEVPRELDDQGSYIVPAATRYLINSSITELEALREQVASHSKLINDVLQEQLPAGETLANLDYDPKTGTLSKNVNRIATEKD